MNDKKSHSGRGAWDTKYSKGHVTQSYEANQRWQASLIKWYEFEKRFNF